MLDARSTRFSDWGILFIMKPSFIDIIGYAAFVVQDGFD